MARKECIVGKDGEHFVNIDITHAGMRYHFEGRRRNDEAKAQADLTYIYSAATTGATRAEGLQAMKVAAKTLRDEAKAAAQNARGYRHQAVRGGNFYTYIGPSNHTFKLIGSWPPMACACFAESSYLRKL